MTIQEQERVIYDLIYQVTRNEGLELVEVKIGVHKRDVLIQVLADRIHGGIGIEECTKLNHSIVEAIDKASIFSEDGYSLEVSSPGLDRPLATTKDFLRNINSEVRVLLKTKIAGKGEHAGIIKAVEEHAVIIVVKDQKEISIPIDQIFKGVLVI